MLNLLNVGSRCKCLFKKYNYNKPMPFDKFCIFAVCKLPQNSFVNKFYL